MSNGSDTWAEANLGLARIKGPVRDPRLANTLLVHRPYPTLPSDSDGTYLLAYDLESGSYLGAGAVPGQPQNQFSFDVWTPPNGKKHLRVATTKTVGRRVSMSTHITTLAPDGQGLLKVLGQTADLAPTETMQSMRFMEDKGYLVTYRFIDPLFALDLSDPSNPRVTGELKVPGFSTYLHPIAGNRLIGIGSNGNWGYANRTKVSLFDVSDPLQPLESYTQELDPFEYTNATWDHHAFIWSSGHNLLAVPTTIWPNSQIRLLSVTGSATTGTLSFASLNATVNVGGNSYLLPAQLKRVFS